jgi:predicted metal-dependent hydrolase
MARRVTDYLKRQARHDLDVASRRHAISLNVSVVRVSVRDTTSRWGSCSHTGRLSYSWRLILAPPFVLDYLAAHEVSHLRELNHSARFWVLCKSLSPHSDTARAWLAHNGPALHAIGAED